MNSLFFPQHKPNSSGSNIMKSPGTVNNSINYCMSDIFLLCSNHVLEYLSDINWKKWPFCVFQYYLTLIQMKPSASQKKKKKDNLGNKYCVKLNVNKFGVSSELSSPLLASGCLLLGLAKRSFGKEIPFQLSSTIVHLINLTS